ncbi:hypothetical protein G9A89_002130 [Geosiphon pyriformis]|nr:hypothetical protein G9A89_002130 [Geosiphon pyriformis]
MPHNCPGTKKNTATKISENKTRTIHFRDEVKLKDQRKFRTSNKFFNRSNMFMMMPRSTEENSEKKVAITDQDLLNFFEEHAGFAQKAYCLDESFKFGDGIYAHAVIKPESKEIFWLKPNIIIIYFKGNKISIEDWSPAKTRLTQFEDVEGASVNAHFYYRFLSAQRSLVRTIADLVSDNRFEKYWFYFTGHGEGAVWAIFAALAFKFDITKADVRTVTFGQPRLGNIQFADHVNQIIPKTFRFTHSDDLIPQLPSRKDGYLHHQREFWISNSASCDCNTLGQTVYECFSIMTNEYLEENPYCNQKPQRRYPNEPDSHFGPYFGKFMGLCLRSNS